MSFVLVVNLEIKAGEVDVFMAKALENGKSARETEPGCRQFDVLVDPKDKTKVMFYEVYADEAAFEAHQQTAHFKKYFATALDHLVSRNRTIFTRIAP
jgi:autoinducer 2-degrading protein